MRRRPREHDPGELPPELTHFTGHTYAEGRAWLDARMEWWDLNHPDPDDPYTLQRLLDGLEQVPDQPFCGGPARVRDGRPDSLPRPDGTWCGNADCACRAL